MSTTKIISLGGSVIVPGKVDLDFLNSFKELIISFVKKDYKFVIYCGGGRLARDYQGVAKKFNVNETNLDWIGIYATRLNASLLRAIFDEYANEEIIIEPTEKIDFKKPISIGCGWKPGWSTDYDSVLVAKQLGADTIINVTNVEYIYDKDPRKNKSAKPIKKITWHELRKMFSDKWIPGLNAPFDPVASKVAEKNRIRVILIGKSIENLKKVLDGRDFDGSTILG